MPGSVGGMPYRVLMVHNFHRVPGGEDESFRQEIGLLRRMGHEVVVYTRDNEIIEATPKWRIGIRSVWSLEDFREIRRLIRKTRPHIMHIQNTFPLISPSILYAAKLENVATVYTLRNYRFLCLNAYLFRDGRVCDVCLNRGSIWPGIVHRCYQKSLAGSLVTASMTTVHRALKTFERKVDGFIALTPFAKELICSIGISKRKVFVKPNFVSGISCAAIRKKRGAIYVGRLSAEKGVLVLLEAWARLDTQEILTIVGDGPLKDRVVEFAGAHQNVRFLGQAPIEKVYEILLDSALMIFPSLWYEGMPRTIIEAFAHKTPVIASKLGAMETMIVDGETGCHVEPGNALDLQEKLGWMLSHPEEGERMGDACRNVFDDVYTPEANYQIVKRIYDAVVAGC